MTDVGLPKPTPIQCTAGAIPFLNEKGEVSMKKVKVQRYISGKRPDFAPESSEESDEELELKLQNANQSYPMGKISSTTHSQLEDNHYHDNDRENVLNEDNSNDDDSLKNMPVDTNVRTKAEILEKLARHKQMHQQNMVEYESTTIHKEYRDYQETTTNYSTSKPIVEERSSSEEEEQDDEDEEEIERRRMALRRKALERLASIEDREGGEGGTRPGKRGAGQPPRRTRSEEEPGTDSSSASNPDFGTGAIKSESSDGSGEETSEDGESSEDEDDAPFQPHHHQRLKPVFVAKKDRITIQEKEKEDQRQKELETLAKKLADYRKKDSLRLAEQEIKREFYASNEAKEAREPNLEDVLTDDNDEETGYERWKTREAERIKRDRDEIEKAQQEKLEIERLHNMTEEERLQEAHNNPKLVTNKPQKGKYKFLQKYYHRGAFYLDKEEDVLKRDVSAPTLEDHFDKTIMPKIMQVKNFGKSGRTKYTHLVDQDTTLFDSPWTAQNPMNIKFVNTHSGGMKQVFNRPASSKKTK